MKPFLTYEQQIDKLIYEKGLIVPDRERAKLMLRQFGYFALIDGYKFPLRNPMTRKYEPGTTFEDIVALYEFDAALRSLFSDALITVERQLRSGLSYAFCARFGADQKAYLAPENYSHAPRNSAALKRLLKLLRCLANENIDYEYILYQRKRYGNVPLWVLVSAMTFGQLSKMYLLLAPGVQADIAKQYAHVNERELGQFLRVLVLFRNCCAHGERLFTHKMYSEIPNTALHVQLSIEKKGSHYVMGKRDLFACVIALRHLLGDERFAAFGERLSRQIDGFAKQSIISKNVLLSVMGFPDNWETIHSFHSHFKNY